MPKLVTTSSTSPAAAGRTDLDGPNTHDADRTDNGHRRADMGEPHGCEPAGIDTLPRLSPAKTVGHHVDHIYAKICGTTQPAAALFAMEHDLLRE